MNEQVTEAALSLEGIARRFGRRWPLRGVTMRVERGEVVAVTGRNGSGKTTLLRIIATALKPTRGSGRVFGRDLVDQPDAVRERTGLMGQSPGLYPDLTAAENLRFARKMWGPAATGATVEDALDIVGLAREADSRVRAFSAGMKRRLALGRLLLRPPGLLLLDEPYASFDAEGVTTVNAFLERVRAGGGAAIVATHDLSRGAGTIDRVLHLESGRVRARDARGADSTPPGDAGSTPGPETTGRTGTTAEPREARAEA